MSDTGFYKAPAGKPSPGKPIASPTEADSTMPAGKVTRLDPSPGGTEIRNISGPAPVSKDMV